MSSDTPRPDEAHAGPQPAIAPPALPARLLDPVPVIAVGALIWLVVAVLAFSVPALEGWRPVALAGLGTGALGTTIFVWQRSAAQRGVRGAQVGLTTSENGN
ncbi:MAG TPA: DUF2530 domain-containing protein [Mycobacterium sp.]|nr:DUF2530 domain-containing protein [Mycobacterium sp.]